MKEYVKLFNDGGLPEDLEGNFDLYSEDFDTREEAEAFSEVFLHNYYTPGEVVEKPDGKFYVVCNGAEVRILRSCFVENETFGFVANRKYDSRGKRKADEYFAAKGTDHCVNQPSESSKAETADSNDMDIEKPDVRLFRDSPTPSGIDGHVDLHSQDFYTKESAEYFAEVFTHNYFTPAVVKERPDGKFYVECLNAEWRLLCTDFIENPDMCLVENIKNPWRGPKKAKQYFAASKKKLISAHLSFKMWKYIMGLTVALLFFAIVPRSEQAGTIAKVIGIFSFLVLIGLLCEAFSNKPHKTNYSWDTIDSMSGEQFERFVSALIVANKLGSTRETRRTGDFGVDIILNGNTAIQCKRSAKNLGIKPLQEVYAGMRHYGCTCAIVVTNAHFTQNAITLAEELGITLWDRDTIRRMM